MRYHDITQANRFRLPATHPIIAEIVIDPADWYDFQRLDADNEDTCIIGHDDPGDGMMTVYVACISTEVRDRLLDGWG